MMNEIEILERNELFLQFFKKRNFTVSLAGKADTPQIIWRDSTVLSVNVHNYTIVFRDKPRDGNILAEYKVHNDKVTQAEIMALLDKGQHRPCFRIKVTGSELFLTGFNALEVGKLDTLYPVFAPHKPKIYFEKDYATQIAKKYQSKVPLEVI